jgi:hypothetical protein
MKNLILSVSAFFVAQHSIHSQDQNIQDYIDSYVGVNARPYPQTLSNLLTSTINTGVWEWSARDKKFRFMLGSPQLTLGGLLNSEVSGRFLTYSLGLDLGRIRFIGLGVRHSITGYFDNPPFDFFILRRSRVILLS